MSKSQLLHRRIDASNNFISSAHLPCKIRTPRRLNLQNATIVRSSYHYLAEPGNPKSNVSQYHPHLPNNLHSAVQILQTNFLRRSALPPTPLHSRTFLERSSSSARTPTPLSPEAYHGLADKFFHNLIRRLEALQEDRDDVDSDYSAGVLTVVFPPHGTYVINKQPPNNQIWLSSPVSGPKRYDWLGEQPKVEKAKKGEDGNPVVDDVAGDWVYMRDGSLLSELLRGELGVDMESKLEGDE
ncbi:MAG: hypothetical protein Q9167_001168 [Letrouitia subvulpina]